MAEMNDINPPTPVSAKTANAPAAGSGGDNSVAGIKFRINPGVIFLVIGGALSVDLLQNFLGFVLIGEFGINQIIGSLSVAFFFPVIFYVVSDPKNPVMVYGLEGKNLYKLGTLAVAGLSEILPLANELPAVTAFVVMVTSAVYLEDIINSGVIGGNRFLKTVGKPLAQP